MSQPQQPNDDQDEKPLAPIPSDGTSAPSDSERIFGQSKGKGSQQSDQSDDRSGHKPDPDRVEDPDGLRGGSPRQGREGLDEEEQRKLRIRGRTAIILGLGGLVIGVLFLPSGVLFGLPLTLAGGVLGVGAYVRGRRAGMSVPGSIPAMVLGAFALVAALAIITVSVVFRGELQQAANCLDGANTRIAQEQCMQQMEDSLQERGIELDLSDSAAFGSLGGGRS